MMGKVSTEILRFFLLLCSLCFRISYATTAGQDTAVLRALMADWESTPPSWGRSDDPCGTWEGVNCSNGRVTLMKLASMGIKGMLSSDIGQLSQLQILDLSYNKDLGGTLSPTIGDLKELTTLIMVGCSFKGNIPAELGSLPKLSYLALNSNQFSGRIPAALGNLSDLYWLDVADNQLSGPIPISSSSAPGLDQLVHTKHFHFNKNQLSGQIPEALFSRQMSLIHLLLDGNQLKGEIPGTLGLVKTLEVVRLDRNSLTGKIPSNFNNLTKVMELHLANNKLDGPVPDLSGMGALNYVDLSNNTFDLSEAPTWFQTLQSLTALIIQSGNLHGALPSSLFSIPTLQQVILDNNNFNGTLDMGSSISPYLTVVSLKNNDLGAVLVTKSYNGTLILVGNPVCNLLPNTMYCNLGQRQSPPPYSTSLSECNSSACNFGQSINPQSCSCAHPYAGVMYFRAPFFRDVTNDTVFQDLERSLWTNLGLSPGSVFLANPYFNSDQYMQVQVKLFPSGGSYFTRSEIMQIGFHFSNQTYKPPKIFGPYYFIADPYPFPDEMGSSSKKTPVIIGIATGCGVLLVALVVAGAYALKQRRRYQAASELSRRYASWARSEDNSDVPQLKGARWFSYDELKRSTNNFSATNEVGSGGYGKVYRGMLNDGQVVAIKRAQQGSMQGGLEFKTEIELLSRVHHKNLVGLIGFCFEQGEQMLVYEYMPNGTLRDSLTGRSGVHLDWKRRLRVMLGAARGLTYLHELANPPIIHRDVKTSNILLDDNLNAKVSDFGLSKLVSEANRDHVSTQVKGTMGYLDPEYFMTQQLTEKSDVYSFGVVMLELITGKQPIDKGKYIVREVKKEVKLNDEQYCGIKEMVDPNILTAVAPMALPRFLRLALRCTEESSADRPAMSDVVKEIESAMQADSVSTNSTGSGCSSATDFLVPKDADRRNPYADTSAAPGSSSASFESSGAHPIGAKIEPK